MPCVSVVGVLINEVPITAFEDSPSWSNVHHCGLRPFFAGDALCELQVSFHWRTVSCPILREPHQIIPCSQDRDFLPRLWKVHHNNIFLREVSLKTWKSCVCENICQNRNYRAEEQSNKNIKPDQNIWMVNIWKHCKTCEKKKGLSLKTASFSPLGRHWSLAKDNCLKNVCCVKLFSKEGTWKGCSEAWFSRQWFDGWSAALCQTLLVQQLDNHFTRPRPCPIVAFHFSSEQLQGVQEKNIGTF